ncbi:MAG: Na/Pi symporter [Alphaproteobacteria bacterium]|nr:Na/Pi symporter [Alphaproteobacteria bacterium]
MLFEAISAILGGLGLAMFGMRQIQVSLQQMAGRRLRSLMRHATRSTVRAAATGIVIGAVTQSTNAASYIVLGLVTTGFLPLRRALAVAAWSAVGTAAIVLLATIRLELVVLYVVGVTGFLQVSRFRDSPLWGPAITALFGVGTLFLGLQILRRSLGPVTEAPWFTEVVAFSHGMPLALVALGLMLALVVQSSSTVAAAVVALAATDWFSFDALLALVYGACIGSALSSLIVGWRMTGTARQLLLFQAFAKASGVLALAGLAAVEHLLGVPSALETAVRWLAHGPAGETGIAFAAIQLVAALLATLGERPLAALAARLAPADVAESLSQPRYLYDEALGEPATALDLVEREQARLAAMLPDILDRIRADAVPGGARMEELSRAVGGLVRATDRFLADLLARQPGADVVGRAIALRSRNEMVLAQSGTLVTLVGTVERLGSAEGLRPLLEGMVESLHLLLSTTADAMATPDPDAIAMLRLMTGDRGEIVERVRQGAVRDHGDLPAAMQDDLFLLTGLFERSVWLVGRLAWLLDAETAAAAP